MGGAVLLQFLTLKTTPTWDFLGSAVVTTVLSMQGAQVQSLVRDLRSFMLCGAAKNKTTLMLWLP